VRGGKPCAGGAGALRGGSGPARGALMRR
jgi:hypothetical protein